MFRGEAAGRNRRYTAGLRQEQTTKIAAPTLASGPDFLRKTRNIFMGERDWLVRK